MVDSKPYMYPINYSDKRTPYDVFEEYRPKKELKSPWCPNCDSGSIVRGKHSGYYFCGRCGKSVKIDEVEESPS